MQESSGCPGQSDPSTSLGSNSFRHPRPWYANMPMTAYSAARTWSRKDKAAVHTVKVFLHTIGIHFVVGVVHFWTFEHFYRKNNGKNKTKDIHHNSCKKSNSLFLSHLLLNVKICYCTSSEFFLFNVISRQTKFVFICFIVWYLDLVYLMNMKFVLFSSKPITIKWGF